MKGSRSRSYVQKRLPKIPKTLPSLLGSVPVTLVKELKDKKGKEVLGMARWGERDVRVVETMPLVTQWYVYWHEWGHMVLFDAGVLLSEEKVEQICDVFALARVREMLDA